MIYHCLILCCHVIVMWPHSHCLILLFLYYMSCDIFFLHPLLDLCCNFCASCDFLWPQIVGYRLPYVSLGSDYSLHVLIISIVLLLSANHILCFLLLLWLSFGYGQNKSCINKTLCDILNLCIAWYSFLRKSIFMVIAFSYVQRKKIEKKHLNTEWNKKHIRFEWKEKSKWTRTFPLFCI